jgi:hypothetical protein
MSVDSDIQRLDDFALILNKLGKAIPRCNAVPCSKCPFLNYGACRLDEFKDLHVGLRETLIKRGLINEAYDLLQRRGIIDDD